MNRPAGGRELAELVPLMRRAVALDPASLARLRVDESRATVLVQLAFGVLVARTVAVEDGRAGNASDRTVRADELLAWFDGQRGDEPEARDAQWRSSIPPATGWRRVETVPDDVVRGLVRRGGQALDEATAQHGRPLAELADALLDSVVLTATADDGADGPRAEVSLRALSAVTRMGFLPRGSHVAVDVAGRWTRLAAEFGSVYLERPGLGVLTP